MFETDNLISILTTATLQLLPESNDRNHTDEEHTIIETWTSVLTTVIKINLLILESDEDETYLNIMKVFGKVFDIYTNPQTILPLSDNAASCIFDCLKLVLNFLQNERTIPTDLICVIMKMLCQIKSGM